MIVADDILATLCCPVRKSRLSVMTGSEVRQLNNAIAERRAWHPNGAPVVEPLLGGLAAADGSSVYAIRQDIPILLPELRIVTSPADVSQAGGSPGASESGITTVWEQWAERWYGIPAPARPASDDIVLFEQFVGEACAGAGGRAIRALLLGVTPEIATMHWPERTRLLALDLSEAMIRHVWPGEAAKDATVARANWKAMPVADATYDIVIGDGIFLWQKYPDDVVALAAEARRVLKDTGALVMRLFAKPDHDDPIESIFDDLRSRRIPNSAVLHLRIGTALHRDIGTGIRLGDVYDIWHANVPDEAALLSSLGWPPAMIGTFEPYRGLDTTVAYPTVAELTDLLAPGFRRTVCRLPAYDTQGMFPILVFRAEP